MTTPRLGLHLTDRCQLDCQHCLRDPARKALDIDVELIARIVAEADEIYRIRTVSLTGGEPSLHPRFERVVDLIVDRGMSWDMVTNGRGFSSVLGRLAERAERTTGLRMLTLSLDGAEEPTHDGIRERGSYRDVLAATKLCVAQGIPFGIQMAVNARNEQELESVGVLAAHLGARHVSYAMTQPSGTVHDVPLFLPAAEWKRIRERIERLATAVGITVVLPEGHYEAAFSTCGPLRGETLHVDVQGNLTLCCLHSQVPSASPGNDIAGNLNELTLVAAHRRLLHLIRTAQDRVLERFEDDRPDSWRHFHCNGCLASHERPHWTDSGALGPTAQRERWHGVWTPGPDRHGTGASAATGSRHRLRIVRS